MDPFTHALSGALVARATAPRAQDPAALPLARRLLVGAAAAAAPDLDFVLGYAGPVEYLLYHRGVTHSLILAPLWAWALAYLLWLVWRRDRPWRAYFGASALGLAAHIAGDLVTSFGTMIFAPLSDARYALGTTFIVDLWFTAIIVAALAASAAWRARRLPALAGLVVLAGYVALQATLKQRALEWGEGYARSQGLRGAEVTAQPRPVSPFNWMVVVRAGEEVRYSFVNLLRREAPPRAAGEGFLARLDRAYLPLAQARWVRATRFGESEAERALAREAWAQPRFAFFRWFAEEPVLLRVERGNPSTCAWFQDLRFFVPGRESWPFRYGMCREGGGPWRLFQLVGEDTPVPLRSLSE